MLGCGTHAQANPWPASSEGTVGGFSPDGLSLATVGRESAVLWDTATWRQTLSISTGHDSYPWEAAFSPGGVALVIPRKTA